MRRINFRPTNPRRLGPRRASGRTHPSVDLCPHRSWQSSFVTPCAAEEAVSWTVRRRLAPRVCSGKAGVGWVCSNRPASRRSRPVSSSNGARPSPHPPTANSCLSARDGMIRAHRRAHTDHTHHISMLAAQCRWGRRWGRAMASFTFEMCPGTSVGRPAAGARGR